MLVSAARREPDEWFGRLIAFAFALKVIATGIRYAVLYLLYGGVGDAMGYSAYAEVLYKQWRSGQVVWDVPDGGVTGTAFMRLVTTAAYTVVGPAPILGFLVFAVFAFWGAYFMYRAFRIALPEGDRKRYALLIFLLPSFLYWPSSIGKEAWLMFWIGLVALGGAKFYARQRGAVLLLAGGLLGTAMVRPHFAALLVTGLAVGQVFRPRGNQAIDIIPKIAGAALMIAVGFLVAGHSAAFLGIDEVNVETVQAELETAGENTSQGGSEFEAVPWTSPLGLPASMVTVMLRPFPWEAHNAQVFLSALEGFFLLGLLVLSWKRILRLPGVIRRSPYVTFCLVYVLLFVWAFSGFSNFGILTRERVLVLPFFLVLAALPRAKDQSKDAEPASPRLEGSRA